MWDEVTPKQLTARPFRDQCCTITLCDVTLGDHEIKVENSTDLSVHLMDVKVLNSTAIKLKLSAKNPQDVTIEISPDNRVWSRQKPDKGERILPEDKATVWFLKQTNILPVHKSINLYFNMLFVYNIAIAWTVIIDKYSFITYGKKKFDWINQISDKI